MVQAFWLREQMLNAIKCMFFNYQIGEQSMDVGYVGKLVKIKDSKGGDLAWHFVCFETVHEHGRFLATQQVGTAIRPGFLIAPGQFSVVAVCDISNIMHDIEWYEKMLEVNRQDFARVVAERDELKVEVDRFKSAFCLPETESPLNECDGVCPQDEQAMQSMQYSPPIEINLNVKTPHLPSNGDIHVHVYP